MSHEVPGEFALGKELLAAPKAAVAALEEKTGVQTELGPRPSEGRGVRLYVRPQSPIIERARESGFGDQRLYRVVYDTTLRLVGRGSLSGESFYAEAVQAHFRTNVALERPFEVDATEALPNDRLPADRPASEPSYPPIIVDGEEQGAGAFFEERPGSGDYIYRKDWLLSLRFDRTVTEDAVEQLYEAGGSLITVDVR